MWKYVLFFLAIRTLGRLPVRVSYFIAARLADLVYVCHKGLRQRVWANMRHVLGADAGKRRLRQVAREVLRNAARYYVDLMRIPYLDVEDFRRYKLRYHGHEENLVPALASGRGVILAGGHLGSPELALQALLSVGIRVLALTEPLRPQALSRLVDGLRSSQGHIFLPVNISSVKAAIRTIKAGGAVGLMCDRDIEGRSITIPLCGVQTKVPVGAVELAMRTGAIIIPIFAHRVGGDRFEAYMEPPVEMVGTGDSEADLRTNVARLLACFEEHLRRTPGQWIVLESVWEDGTNGSRPSSQPWAVGRKP
ncbi:MAG: lysophospholipid acyltransferase family protein [Dehalococcoidia bacterium]